MSLCDSVNCDAITSEKLECDKCDAFDLIFNCNFLLFDVCVCNVNGLIGFEKDEFIFKMLFCLCCVDGLFSVGCLEEFRTLVNVATTKIAFKFGLLSLCDSVNCDAFAGKKLECVKRDAIDVIFACYFF